MFKTKKVQLLLTKNGSHLCARAAIVSGFHVFLLFCFRPSIFSFVFRYIFLNFKFSFVKLIDCWCSPLPVFFVNKILRTKTKSSQTSDAKQSRL